MKKLTTLSKLVLAASILCLSSCATSYPTFRPSQTLYDKEGKPALTVDKHDLNDAASSVSYRLRKDVWARLGDAALNAVTAAGQIALSELVSKNDSYK